VEALAKAEELAATAAPEADLDQLVHQDPTEIPATPEDPEPPVSPARHHSPSALRPLQHHASLAPTDSQDLQAHQDPMDNQEAQDRQERVVETHRQDLQAHQDPAATPEAQDSQEDQDSQELQPRASREELELPDPQEMPERQDSQEAQDKPEAQDKLAAQDPRDHQDHQETPETMASPVSPDRPVNPEAEARRASAPSTAPSTVECSSRMELVVVKQSEPAGTDWTPTEPMVSQSHNSEKSLNLWMHVIRFSVLSVSFTKFAHRRVNKG